MATEFSRKTQFTERLERDFPKRSIMPKFMNSHFMSFSMFLIQMETSNEIIILSENVNLPIIS